LLEQDRADETDDGVFVREDADHLGTPLDRKRGRVAVVGVA
jgi:hypothetical protein